MASTLVIFASLSLLFTVYGAEKMHITFQKEWDLQTITLADYSLSFDISPQLLKKLKDKLQENIENGTNDPTFSFGIRLKNLLSSEIELKIKKHYLSLALAGHDFGEIESKIIAGVH